MISAGSSKLMEMRYPQWLASDISCCHLRADDLLDLVDVVSKLPHTTGKLLCRHWVLIHVPPACGVENLNQLPPTTEFRFRSNSKGKGADRMPFLSRDDLHLNSSLKILDGQFFLLPLQSNSTRAGEGTNATNSRQLSIFRAMQHSHHTTT